MSYEKELSKLLSGLENIIKEWQSKDIESTIERLSKGYNIVQKSHSLSTQYAHYYYKDFALRPENVSFKQDKKDGLEKNWKEYTYKEIKDAIIKASGSSLIDNKKLDDLLDKSKNCFHNTYNSIISILGQLVSEKTDGNYENILYRCRLIDFQNREDIMKNLVKERKIDFELLRDTHVFFYCKLKEIKNVPEKLNVLSGIIKEICFDFYRDSQKENVIFIGHGGSEDWRAVKDFIHDTLGLEYEEFERESGAGMTIIKRLEDMFNKTTFAIIVMTAENETPEGKLKARDNVIHEIGLFQGRLGFEKVIILYEEGCEDFSNIHGLIYIPFLKNKIKTTFENIRKTLQREKIIS